MPYDALMCIPAIPGYASVLSLRQPFSAFQHALRSMSFVCLFLCAKLCVRMSVGLSVHLSFDASLSIGLIITELVCVVLSLYELACMCVSIYVCMTVSLHADRLSARVWTLFTG